MVYDLPIEITTMILSNLGQTDLLGCRLVNQAWNRECLVVFRKSRFRTHLNIRQGGGNAGKYIEFVSTNNPQLVLPIHLSLEGLPLRHPKSLEIVTSLQRMSGPGCIQSLSLDIGVRFEEDDRTVMTLLTDISHTMKTSLHTLKIYKYKSEDCQIIVSILESLAKTLKSLTIGVIIDISVADKKLQFPHLPYLESLRLCLCHGRMTIGGFSGTAGLNCDDMNLNSETFPSLKLVRLPFTFSLRNGSPLPSVKTLTILVLGCSRNPYGKSSMHENFQNLRRIFPNAKTISLKEELPDRELLHSGVKNRFLCKTVLKELLISELAPQIHQIQIDGASTNILGEILEQNMILPQPQIMMTYSGKRNYEAEALIQEAFGLLTAEFGIEGIQCNDVGAGPGRMVVFKEGSQSGHKMTNVKKIKLVFRSDEYGREEFLDLQLNLMSIAKSLPSLTEIKLIGIKRELYLKQFDDLAIEYPNLLLRVTKLGPKKQYGKQ